MFSVPNAAIATIATASIAGVISLLGLVITKENKTSEFRQAWVDALRSELATLVAQLHAAQMTMEITKDEAKRWDALREDLVAANRALVSIRLRLNPKEKMHEEVLDLLQDLQKDLKGKEGKPESLDAYETFLTKAGQRLLKREWDRVRDGEMTFRGAKIALLVLTSLGIVALIFLTFNG